MKKKNKPLNLIPKIQIVDIDDEISPCSGCGCDLMNLENIRFKGETDYQPAYWDENYECRNCGRQFIMRYEIFTSDNHIHSRIFFEDMNNLHFNWMENLSPEQQKKVAIHLESCHICRDRQDEVMLGQVRIKTFFNNLKSKLRRG